MEDLFDILDSKEVAPTPVANTESAMPQASQKKDKVNLWEDPIDPVQINQDGLLRFNRMFTVASHGEVPGEILIQIDQIAKSLHSKGFTFRFDGHAKDTASMAGYSACKDRSEIFLPWKGFNKEVTAKLNRPSEKAYGYASGVHTKFNTLPPSVKAILSRNIHVLTGDECNTPVNLCIIWTADGAETKQEVKYATTGNMAFFIFACELMNIPVFNLKNATAKDRIAEFLNSMLKDS